MTEWGKKMAGGLLEYSGLVTKTKAMRARLLGADDYTAISEYESVTDFIAFLRHCSLCFHAMRSM